MIKNLIKILLGIIVVLLILLSTYIIYMSLSYYRIEDKQVLLDENYFLGDENYVEIDKKYTISTYNIGFGAYTREFTFFMDSGVMKEGTVVNGSGSRAKDKQTVIDNTSGACSLLDNIDFMFFQEVDIDSTRSYNVNMYNLIKKYYENVYYSVYASNFHSKYLLYPFSSPHGSVKSGIATFSKLQFFSSERRSLPVDNAFFTKFFDLDRCLSVSRVITRNNKQLVLINTHLSAYDKEGIYRAKQLEVLNSILVEEKEKGNYVIVGGDFNHDIADSLNTFETEQEIPEWVQVYDKEKLTEGYRFATTNSAPTCRSTDIPFEEGVNYTAVLDGFIVSDNITIVSVENRVVYGMNDVNFLYSDHNPVILQFKLS